MCGISAVVARRSSVETTRMLERMHAPIAHRGPDGERLLLWDDEATRVIESGGAPADASSRVGLAFRRLKIVDLSERASQPMRSVRTGTWLVFNGEIYNFLRLREELRLAGHEFHTESDSEVVLAAYDEWGSDCFTRFDGMWAIVLLDVARRRVVASRDRLGIKPLHWMIDGDRMLLSSEIRQLIAATGRARANMPLVQRYLRGNRIPCYDETFFAGIRMMPAATWFELSLDADVQEPAFRRYWTVSTVVAPHVNGDGRAAYARARDGFETLLRETVASHRQADVRVGSLLSGGLDSSVLAAILASQSGEELPTFSFGFRERAPELCELPYVDAIAARYPNITTHETALDSDWLAANAQRAIATLEEPPLALPALAQYRVFELCRQHGVTVVLDGEGADEVLAGYAPYQRALLMDYALGLQPVRFAHELRAIARQQQRPALAMMYDYFGTPLVRRARRVSVDWLVPGDFAAAREQVERSSDPSRVNRLLFDSTFSGNVKIVLGYTDRNAMAHSVEARVPYMDHRVVEQAFAMPGAFKAGEGNRKRVLRDLGRKLLPAMVTERKDRMGFATPDALLMSGSFARTIEAAITDDGFTSLPLFDREALRRFTGSWRAGANPDLRAVWRLYALAAWRDAFHVTM